MDLSYILSIFFILVILPIIKTIYNNLFWREFFPFIRNRSYYKLHNRTIKLFEELFKSKNIKSIYRFVDHASKTETAYHEDYDDNESFIYLNQNKSLNLYEKPVDNIQNELKNNTIAQSLGNHLKFWIDYFNKEIRDSYNEDFLKKECLGISYIIHNRDQRKEKDEAHWFRIECFKMNQYSRILLNELYTNSNCNSQDNYNQPQVINKSYPFITKCKVCCNICFRNDNKKCIESSFSRDSDKDFFLKFNIDDFICELKTSQMNLKKIKDIIKDKTKAKINAKSELNEHPSIEIKNCFITDIGISNGEITLFTEIWVTKCFNFIPMINKKDFIESDSDKYSPKLYYYLSNFFIRNKYE